MRPVGIFFATREGHTQQIAEYLKRGFEARGIAVEMRNVRNLTSTLAVNDHRAAVLAASVHAGQHEAEMVQFVRLHRTELDALPTAFLSVTLSQAGVEGVDRTADERARFAADVQGVLDKFVKETGWHPDQVAPVAGALRYSKYNIVVRFIMRRIARKAGAATDTSKDYDYTNWKKLDDFVEEFAKKLVPSRAAGATFSAPLSGRVAV